MITKYQIKPKGKVKVYWEEKPENYNKDYKTTIKKLFSDKYNIPTKNIEVIYKPIKINKKGDVIDIDGGNIDNIMTIPYQQELFKDWLEREGKDVDFKRLLSLDNKVNMELDVDYSINSNKKYKIKWITLNNFLSFGENNHFPVDNYRGFTVVNSEPANQGGKCVRYDTNIKIKYNVDEIVKKLGFLPDELK